MLAVVNLHAYTNLTSDKLQSWINGDSVFNFILVDLRDLTTNDTVIATEICKPYNLSWNAKTFEQSLYKIPHNIPVILYCLSGRRSSLAASMMTDSGFINIYSLDGGISNWNRPAKPITFVKPAVELPAFSMNNLSTVNNDNNRARKVTLQYNITQKMISIGEYIHEPHTISLYNLQGEQLVRIENPFSTNLNYFYSGNYCSGKMVFKLQTKKHAQFFMITEYESGKVR
jgi:rhodanese-related sulfurtransferase